jgi:LytS/YehU family sensor histidine kinase
LKAQLHPHFFFNTINNIYALALKQSADTAPMVAKLAEMMRYILYEADQPVVLLEREIEFLNNYIGTEKIRHKRNDIRFDVQRIDRNIRIEPLLLLPFVENAFKHGLEQETGNGYVHIVICLVENELTVEVTNSKPAEGEIRVTKGIGMQNLQKRLAILYPGKHQLLVHDEADKYQVTLTLLTA